jgi:protein TonB
MSADDIFETKRARYRRLICAGALAAALHGASAAIALNWRDEDADEASGPMMIDLAPVVLASPVDMPDVAHGLLMQESVATPPVTPQMEETKAEETPIEPTPPAPDPEVALPQRQEVQEEKPEEEATKETAPAEPVPTQTAAAPLTTAPPKVDAPAGARAVAPVPGSSPVPAEVRESWHRSLMSHLNRYKRYPGKALAQKIQGVANVAFTIDRTGRVLSSRVVQGSGSEILDEEALAVLNRASPLPEPPGQLAGDAFTFGMPIPFRIKR